MKGRRAILNKSGTTQINKLISERLNMPVDDVRQVTRPFWLDIDSIFIHCSGHSVYIERFGHFIIYTKGIHARMRDMEKSIMKKLKYMDKLEKLGITTGKRELIGVEVSKLMTQIILLIYTIDLYKRDILESYPKKYKIHNEEGIKRLILRLEKLFNISIFKFPISVSNPIQKIFVRKLRNAGLLQNPVISGVGRGLGSKNTKV